jgi:hypothetical protein
MENVDPTTRDRRLTELELKRVLERAAHIDARETATVNVQELTRIAQQAGISEHAVTQALLELEAHAQTRANPGSSAAVTQASADKPVLAGPAVTGWRRLLNVAGIGVATGAIARITSHPIEGSGLGAILGVIALNVLALALTVDHARQRSWSSIQKDLLTVYASFTAGFYIFGRSAGSEPAAFLSTNWLVAAAVGALLTLFARQRVKDHGDV